MSYFDVVKERFPVLIPYWVEKQLRRKSMPLDTIFDLNELSKVCSGEDIAIMIAMNREHASAFYGVTYHAETINSYWYKYYQEAFNKIEPLTKIYSTQFDERLCADAMCVIKSNSSTQPGANSPLVTPKYSEPYEITAIQPAQYPSRQAAIAIVIYPGYFGVPGYREHQISLVRAYLRQSYVFSDYDVVARSPLFTQYMRTSIVEPA